MRSTKPMLAVKIGYIVMSAVCAFFGTALVIGNKNLILSDFGTLIGIFMLVFGAVKLVGYFSKDLFRLAFQHDMASGLLMAVIGVFVLFKPEDAANNIHRILAVLAIADGLLKIQIALDSKKFGINLWWLILSLFSFQMIMRAIEIPIIFRFGSKYGSIYRMTVGFFLCFGVMVYLLFGDLSIWGSEEQILDTIVELISGNQYVMLRNFSIRMFVVAGLCYLISYFVSVRLYKKGV